MMPWNIFYRLFCHSVLDRSLVWLIPIFCLSPFFPPSLLVKFTKSKEYDELYAPLIWILLNDKTNSSFALKMLFILFFPLQKEKKKKKKIQNFEAFLCQSNDPYW